MSKSHEPAFPTQMWDEELKEATWLDGGLTKREYFAGLALELSINDVFDNWKKQVGKLSVGELMARDAVQLADALIAELNKDAEA